MARKTNKGSNETEVVLESNENAIFNKETEGLSQSQIIIKRFVRHRAAMVALFFFTTLVVLVYTALDWRIGDPRNPRFTIPGWWRYGFEDMPDLLSEGCSEGTLGCPTIDFVPFVDGDGVQLGQHPFGQDNVGRDYFALVMRGAQRSILVMFIIGLIATTIGTIVGSLAGFFRGWTDALLMRLVDFIITIPVIIIGSVIGFYFGNKGAAFLGLLLGLFSWTGLSRLVRGEFLSLREREFVDAARVAGATTRRIIFKHILPNAIGVIIVSVTLLMSGAILLETALSFLGFGVTSPDVSLGLLISNYQDAFTTRPWLFWYPGIFIIAIALCVNFIGDGLRDAFDPRQRRRLTKKDKENAREINSRDQVA